MLATRLLFTDGALMGLGREGEARYGARNFLELFSVFNTPPLVSVLHGLTEIGRVHELTFRRQSEGSLHLALGGRGWRVTHVDESRRRAWVEPAEAPGKSRWLGGGPPLHFRLAQAMGKVLVYGIEDHLLSTRARQSLAEMREEFSWVSDDHTTLVVEPAKGRARWWTFAGDRYNASVAERLLAADLKCSTDGLGLGFPIQATDPIQRTRTEELLHQIRLEPTRYQPGRMDTEILGELKFFECLPHSLQSQTAAARLAPTDEAVSLGQRSVRIRVHA
jgi:ATP-dependent Lhr-like helicase